MQMQEHLDILRRKGLSITESRSRILHLFLQTEGALAHADIEKHTRQAFDRVTVYRTLQTFLDKGIIHQIPTTDNAVLYALCKHHGEQGRHQDNHVHFLCEQCNKTTCLDEVIVPEVKLPRGFRPLRSAMVVTGACSYCRGSGIYQ